MNSISAKEILITTVLVCAFVGLSYGVECFYCDPTDDGCDDPVAAKKSTRNCEGLKGDSNPMTRVLDQERSRLPPNEPVSYMCAAVKVVNNENSTFEGIYRTCLINVTVHHCNILKDEFENDKFGQVIDCLICNNGLCNSWTMDDGRWTIKNSTAFKNSSPESFTSVLLYTFLSCFFVAYVI